MNNSINDKLKQIRIEDYIWIINFFIIFFAFMSNDYEENYIKTKDKKSWNIFHTINIDIFIIIFLINVYFLYLRYQNLQSLNNTSSKEEVLNANLNYIAAVFIVIGTLIYIYTEITGSNIVEEII